MKRMVLIIAVLILSVLPAFAADMMKTIQHDGQLCANALMKNDIEKIIRYTHPIVIEMSGGKEGFILAIEHGIQNMKDNGVSFISAEVDKPTVVKKIHNTTYAILPQRITMAAPGGHLVSDGHLLAVSTGIEGRSYFVDMAPLNNKNIAMIFPELEDVIDVPDKQCPVFIPDDKSMVEE